jgi:hypothetical protein
MVTSHWSNKLDHGQAQSLHRHPGPRPNHPQPPFVWARLLPATARLHQKQREAVSARYGRWTKLRASAPCRSALPGTRCVICSRQPGGEGCKKAGHQHGCVVLGQNMRQLGAVGICAELVLRSLEVLQGILQTRDF